jgi:hypothetical protein|tara:strand:- start:2944 stop:4113 length:1170 start_codon:yes stop_codon:yes gene_type:complete
MSEDVRNSELAEDIATDAVEVQEESQEEIVDNENLNEEADENLEEAAAKKEMHGEEEEEEEEVKEEAPQVTIPKTKAGTIQAAVEMLKKARKEDAQKLFAKMIKVDETSEEDSVKSAEDAINKVKKAKDPKAGKPDMKHGEVVKAKIENVDFDEDLDALIKEEATLSDEFRGKAGAIFEAVLTSKLTQEVERLESEYANNLEEEVSDMTKDIVEKVDGYLNYVVEQWMSDNEVAVSAGLRTEIAEDFMASLQRVFTEHYIEVPEGKVDLVDELNEQVTELEENLNKSTQDNIDLHQKVQDFEKAEVVRENSVGLVATDAEKLASLVEDIEYDNRDNFEVKVKTVKESYFKDGIETPEDEADSLLGEGTVDVDVSDTMAAYTQAITKYTK